MSDPRGCRKGEGREEVDLDDLVDDVMVWQLGYHCLSELGEGGQRG